MTKFYLIRDSSPYKKFGGMDAYACFDVEERFAELYNVEQREINCKKCKKKQTILCSKRFSQDWCPNCYDIAINKHLKEESKKNKRSYRPGLNIPSWRLAMDDASPEEILNRSPGDFNVPLKSYEEWKEFYSQPHELAKQRAAEKQRQEEARETLKSLG